MKFVLFFIIIVIGFGVLIELHHEKSIQDKLMPTEKFGINTKDFEIGEPIRIYKKREPKTRSVKLYDKPKTKQQLKSEEILKNRSEPAWKLVISDNYGYKMYKREFRNRTEYKHVRPGERPYIKTYHQQNY